MCLFHDHDCTGHEIAQKYRHQYDQIFHFGNQIPKISRQIGD